MNFVHQHIESLDSTNDTLWELSEKLKLSLFHTISADYQCFGKGQDQNIWESEAGKNLLFSSLVFPDFLAASDAFQVSRWVSLSIIDYLRFRGLENLKIKWPNDIYVDGRKIAGILIQNSMLGQNISKSMFGIGLNINQEVFVSDAPNPVSLVQLKPAKYHVLEELMQLIEILQNNYKLLQNHPQRLISYYHQLLYQRGEWKKYQTSQGIIEANIKGVDEFGRLELIDRSSKGYVFDIKEIKFL